MENINTIGDNNQTTDLQSCCKDEDIIQHNNLGGLQGGITNERYHLTRAQWDSLGGNTPNVLPTGGTTGQFLGKLSSTNYDVAWINVSSGGSYAFSNGLTNISGVVGLGGTLTASTNITTGSHGLTIIGGTAGDTVNPYSEMQLNGSQIISAVIDPVNVVEHGFIMGAASVELLSYSSALQNAIGVDQNGVTLRSDNGTSAISMLLIAGGPSVINDTAELGIYYNADYSANNASNPRWIVDKEYVDNHTPDLSGYARLNNDGTQVILGDGTYAPYTGGGGGGSISIVAGTTNRITITNGTTAPIVDIASTYIGQSSLTTLGTITTGVWHGTVIADTYIASAVTWNGKQDALGGTGYVKSTGGTISYDNSTFLTTISGIAAGGDLSGTYPNPTVNQINGISKSFYDPTSSIQTQINSKQVTLVSGTSIKTINSISLLGSGNIALQIPLTAGTDYQVPITLTTTGSSGAATFVSGVLNIPQYSGGSSYTFSTGLTNTSGTVTVNTSQNISTLSNLTSNGFVKTSGSTGALSVDTTVYAPLASPTLTGTPAAPTATTGTNTTQLATTAFVQDALTNSTIYFDVIFSGLGTSVSPIGIVTASSSITGALSSADWTTFNGKISASSTDTLTNKNLTSGTNTFPTFNQNTTGSAAKWTTARNLAGNSVDGAANVAFANKFIVQGTTDAGLSGAQFLGALATGIVKNTTTTGVLSIATAGTDYQVPITLTTTGTSGAATFIGNTINIPQYAGTTYTFSTGLTNTSGTVTVNTSQNISTLSNLTSNGLVKTSGSTGALTIATAGTDYLAPFTTQTANTVFAGPSTGSAATPTFRALATADMPLFYFDPTYFSGGGTSTGDYLTAVATGFRALFSAGTGLTLTTGAFSVNAAQAITSLSTLTSNGPVYTSGGTGVLNVGTTTGSGTVYALATSPTLVTPVLGVATATSINKVTITAPTTSATLTLVTGSSLITAGAFALTLTSTATSNATFPAGSGTLPYIASANSWSAIQTFLRANIATTLTDAVDIANNTAATSGVPLQISPSQRFTGSVWNTTATAAANQFDWLNYATGASGTTPTTTQVWASSLVTATTPSYTTRMTLTNAGLLTLTGSIASGVAGTSIGGFLLSGNTSGTISILPQAAAGTYNFNLPATAGTAGQFLTSAGGGASVMTWTTPFVWTTNATGTDAAYTIVLTSGDNIILPAITANRTVTFPAVVDGKVIYIWNKNSAAFTWNINSSPAVTNAAAATQTTITNQTYTAYIGSTTATAWIRLF